MDYIKTDGKRILYRGEEILLRGFGLGGWFLPEGYMWKFYRECDRPRRIEKLILSLCGEQYAAYFWKEYLNRYITEQDIAVIAGEGFNSVRLPLNARHLCTWEKGYFEFIPETVAKIDELLQWCKQRNVFVILDMHGAPGGQTGQNIDDSEADQPCLFTDSKYEKQLRVLWQELARKYCREEMIAGYDLLNEPLPKMFAQYQDQVLPLYRKLIQDIRQVDPNHMLILEGVHWATDFSIFDELVQQEPMDDNLMLQFHKYWNNPDQDSLTYFENYAEQLQVPLFMGEGGENNLEWYTMLFPLLERQNISWSFWSYKKMENKNSPISFLMPQGWERILEYLKEGSALERDEAIKIFDEFLSGLSAATMNREVFCALKRQVPVMIPCEGYDACHILNDRTAEVSFRQTEPVNLVFAEKKRGEVNYQRYQGEKQPSSENILVELKPGESVSYRFFHDQATLYAELFTEGEGILQIQLNQLSYETEIKGQSKVSCFFDGVTAAEQWIILTCKEGAVRLDNLHLTEADAEQHNFTQK